MAFEWIPANIPDDIKVSDSNINLRDGYAVFSATVTVSGVGVKVAAKTTVEAIDGHASLLLSEMDFGRMPLPQFIKDRFTSLIPGDGRIDLSKQVPMHVDYAQIVQGFVVLEGTVVIN